MNRKVRVATLKNLLLLPPGRRMESFISEWKGSSGDHGRGRAQAGRIFLKCEHCKRVGYIKIATTDPQLSIKELAQLFQQLTKKSASSTQVSRRCWSGSQERKLVDFKIGGF